MNFELVGAISDVEVIAVGAGVRNRALLNKIYGKARWRKMKGIAEVKLKSGVRHRVELHWYEAHGIGRKKIKIKRYLD